MKLVFDIDPFLLLLNSNRALLYFNSHWIRDILNDTIAASPRKDVEYLRFEYKLVHNEWSLEWKLPGELCHSFWSAKGAAKTPAQLREELPEPIMRYLRSLSKRTISLSKKD